MHVIVFSEIASLANSSRAHGGVPYQTLLNGWMDEGWMDGGWMDGWLDGSMDGSMDRWIDGSMDR